jgi:hypothetical protein
MPAETIMHLSGSKIAKALTKRQRVEHDAAAAAMAMTAAGGGGGGEGGGGTIEYSGSGSIDVRYPANTTARTRVLPCATST